MTERPLEELSKETQDIYTRHAVQFDGERCKSLLEKVWLDRFLGLLPQEATVLDVGCGSGEPIAGYLIKSGCCVTGIDFADPMLDMARARFPDHRWIIADMRDIDLGEQFDGIIAWHSFFHLTPPDQEAALACFARHLKTGGALMLTVGPEADETAGQVCGEAVYHASLSPGGYRDALNRLKIEVVQFVANDPDCDFASVLLAKKTG